MIPFARERVTLYNRRRETDAQGRERIAWRRRVLDGCSWVCAHERVRDDGTTRYAQSVVCRIPQSADYLSPGQWDALSDPTGRFTLAPGDLLVRGAVDDEISDALTAAQLVQKYGRSGAMIVQSARENTCVAGLEHYVARASWGSAVGRGHRP